MNAGSADDALAKMTVVARPRTRAAMTAGTRAFVRASTLASRSVAASKLPAEHSWTNCTTPRSFFRKEVCPAASIGVFPASARRG